MVRTFASASVLALSLPYSPVSTRSLAEARSLQACSVIPSHDQARATCPVIVSSSALHMVQRVERGNPVHGTAAAAAAAATWSRRLAHSDTHGVRVLAHTRAHTLRAACPGVLCHQWVCYLLPAVWRLSSTAVRSQLLPVLVSLAHRTLVARVRCMLAACTQLTGLSAPCSGAQT
jgi:hypothetical protein